MKPPAKLETIAGPLSVERVKMKDYGACAFKQATITLDTPQAPHIERVVLLHELTHWALWAASLDEELSAELKERVCDAVGLFVADLLKRNPSLTRYLSS